MTSNTDEKRVELEFVTSITDNPPKTFGGEMGIEAIREAESRGLLDYTIEKALERINTEADTIELAELYSICSDVMFQKR